MKSFRSFHLLMTGNQVTNNSRHGSSVKMEQQQQLLMRPPHSHRFSPPTQWTQV